MKVLMLNGSPNQKGTTYIALNEMKKVFEKEGIESEIVHVGNKVIRGCMDCGYCRSNPRCAFNDDCVNDCFHFALLMLKTK